MIPCFSVSHYHHHHHHRSIFFTLSGIPFLSEHILSATIYKDSSIKTPALLFSIVLLHTPSRIQYVYPNCRKIRSLSMRVLHPSRPTVWSPWSQWTQRTRKSCFCRSELSEAYPQTSACGKQQAVRRPVQVPIMPAALPLGPNKLLYRRRDSSSVV